MSIKRAVIAAATMSLSLNACSLMPTLKNTDDVKQACQDYGSFFDLAALVHNTTVRDMAFYGKSMCDNLKAETVPATIDANTVSWMRGLVEKIWRSVPSY